MKNLFMFFCGILLLLVCSIGVQQYLIEDRALCDVTDGYLFVNSHGVMAHKGIWFEIGSDTLSIDEGVIDVIIPLSKVISISVNNTSHVFSIDWTTGEVPEVHSMSIDNVGRDCVEAMEPLLSAISKK